MRDLYLSAWLFVKNANREGWGLPATEAVACGIRVAASEIQPLRSHLPAGTRWFRLGDTAESRPTSSRMSIGATSTQAPSHIVTLGRRLALGCTGTCSR